MELFLIAVGLSMDAFAVALSIGMARAADAGRERRLSALTVGLYFGVFQAVMPLIGYMLASLFAKQIESVDHWVAFILLGFLGGKMLWSGIKDWRGGGEDGALPQSLSPKTMLPFALATSIDALAVGVSFAFLGTPIVTSVLVIGAVTLVLSFGGTLLGGVLGEAWGAKAEIFGGVILVAIGAKILIEHLA